MKLHPLCLIMFAPLALAGNITVSYSGTISSSQIPSIPVGDAFSGYFTYTVPSPVFTSGPTEVLYSMSQPGDGLYFTADGFWFAAGPATNLEMSVWPNYPAGTATEDFLGVVQDTAGAAFDTNYPGGLTLDQLAVQVFGNTGFLPSLLPPAPFDAGSLIFGDNHGYWTDATVFLKQGNSNFALTGMIDSVQATDETPEPAAFLLSGIGLALALARRRKAPCAA